MRLRHPKTVKINRVAREGLLRWGLLTTVALWRRIFCNCQALPPCLTEKDRIRPSACDSRRADIDVAVPLSNSKLAKSRQADVLILLARMAFLWLGLFHLWPSAGTPPVVNAQINATYADPATCVSCHSDIAKTYRETGMGRSFHRVDASDHANDFATRNTLYNKASERYYTIIEKDGKLYEQRHQTGFDQKDANFEEMQIDYVIGSGNHSSTYLHRTPKGKLLELPVSWYSEMGGSWQMSPGYDRSDQQDFRRPIGYECMSCHNAYPAPDQVIRTADENLFGANLPEGIDCQRCHGPGSAHVRAALTTGASPESIRAAIVNPATLSRDRQMDICQQCHLETTSLRLPH
jgi:hypothetical protein